jgi:predicted transport protein
MSDIKLFETRNGEVRELEGQSVEVEKSLQNLIEKNSRAFLGVRFLASEYRTSDLHKGRIDTLGLDENGYPVIIEYKRSMNQNVINQGLFYLDWLVDHKANFSELVREKIGSEAVDEIDWSGLRLLCIAGGFNRYDSHAVRRINRNIELLRYRRYGDELLLLELINAASQDEGRSQSPAKGKSTSGERKTVQEALDDADPELQDRFEAVKSYCENLGDDVQFKTLQQYFAFKRLKNFACVEPKPRQGDLVIHVKADFDDPDLLDRIEKDDSLRDVRDVGHYGTGNLELRLRSDDDFDRVDDLIVDSYERS